MIYVLVPVIAIILIVLGLVLNFSRRLLTLPPSREDARERMEMLARGLAHELRNPLNAINAHLQLLQEDISARMDEEKGREYLERVEKIKGEVQRLNRILNDFLRYTKLPKPELSLIDLRPVVEEVLDFIEPESKRMGIDLVRDLSPVPKVTADPSQVKQALLNLILNAHEAMPEGGKLTVSLKPDGEFVRVEVTDSGMGMPEEILDKVFKPFFSTKKDGTGLGLTLVKRIMEEHDGKIEIDSRQGQGTTVSLLFPISAG